MKNDFAVMDYLPRPKFSKDLTSISPDSFPLTMPLGQFLFEYLYRRGVRHSFGVPGDFVLPTFTWLEESKIQSITMTHEPAAGFAATNFVGATIGRFHDAGAAAGHHRKSELRDGRSHFSRGLVMRIVDLDPG